MRSLALTVLTMGFFSTAEHAQAQTYDPAYPVCLYVDAWGASPQYRCDFYTMDQCRASATGGTCSLNPYFAGGTASVKQNNRQLRPVHGDRKRS